ncbi:replication initiation protein [candidate division WWE3 bacterium]|jgi:plasmid replication initiation protein|nr:replication initiation protein [candidate division WWE3 bacterium]
MSKSTRNPLEHKVTQSNFIIKRSQGLTLPEKRVIALAISKLDSLRTVPQKSYETGHTIEVSVDDFKTTYPETDSPYRVLCDASKSLLSKVITEPESEQKNRKSYQWCMRAEYVPGEAKVLLTIHPDVMPHLFYLRQQFTTYKLKETANLRSLNSWRLWELLQQFKKTGWLDITVDDFHESMETSPSIRTNFSLLRKKVIEPAIKELEEKNSVKIAFETKKTGRKITSITFHFKPDTQRELDLV